VPVTRWRVRRRAPSCKSNWKGLVDRLHDQAAGVEGPTMGGGWPRTCPFLRLGKIVVALRAGPLGAAFVRVRGWIACYSGLREDSIMRLALALFLVHAAAAQVPRSLQDGTPVRLRLN